MNWLTETLREQQDEAACLAGRQAKRDATTCLRRVFVRQVAAELEESFDEGERLMAVVREQLRQVNHAE